MGETGAQSSVESSPLFSLLSSSPALSLPSFFFFGFSRQGFSVYPWLSWNSLCRPGWPRTQKSACLCLLKRAPPLPGLRLSSYSHFTGWIDTRSLRQDSETSRLLAVPGFSSVRWGTPSPGRPSLRDSRHHPHLVSVPPRGGRGGRAQPLRCD